ncbi:MAG: hypothetical protein ACPHHU_10090, partial [Paracoccaceae bacterium]
NGFFLTCYEGELTFYALQELQQFPNLFNHNWLKYENLFSSFYLRQRPAIFKRGAAVSVLLLELKQLPTRNALYESSS